jgi:hypothetical protein
MSRFHTRTGLFLSLLVLSGTLSLQGQGYLADPQDVKSVPPSAAKAAGPRIMKLFDFEERKIHFNPLPMYWHKYDNGDNGEFPHFATGKLSEAHSRSGAYGFQLLSEGGSVGYVFDRRRIQAKPGNDFQVSGYVHLENAYHCRAKITCAMTNRRGEIIADSTRHSELVGTADHDGQGWARLDLYVPGNYPDARYITLTLFLLQEQQWSRRARLENQIFYRDVKGAAWFDDISVIQLPRIVLETEKPANVFESYEIPEILLDVEGVGTLDYQVKLDILNARNERIRSKEWILTGVEGTKTTSVFSYPELSAGYYKAEISIYSADHLIAVRNLTFIKCAPLVGMPAATGNQFGIVALDDQAGDWQTTTHLAHYANAKWLKLPVWSGTDEAASLSNQKNLDAKLLELQNKRIHIIAAFTDPPDTITQHLDHDHRGIIDVFSQDPQIWRSQVAIVLAQFAQQIPFWQVGSPYVVAAGMWDSRFEPVVAQLNAEFVKFIKDPAIAVSLENHLDVDNRQVGTEYLSLRLPAHIRPSEIPTYLAEHHDKGFGHLWATVEALPQKEYARPKRLIDFAKRLVYTQSAGPEFIFVNHPWSQVEYNARQVVEPYEHFLVFRTLSDLLGNVTYVGRFELASGIPAFIFENHHQGFLVTWNENFVDPEKRSDVSFYFGASPHLTDIFGNPVASEYDKNRMTQFQVSRWPVLLSNIDSSLAEFRSKLQFSPAVFEATVTSQKLTLSIANTFDTAISGRIRFPQDDNSPWTLSPSSFTYMLSK